MADPTLVATPKGETSNSYVTRAAAQTYFDGRFDVTAWENASDANKDRSLIMATARLEQEEYVGFRTLQEQALKWPRIGTYDDDGYHYDDDVVPEPIQQATFELALALLDGSVTLAPTGLEGFKHVQVDVLQVTPLHARRSGTLPDQVLRLLRGLRVGTGSTVRTVRN